MPLSDGERALLLKHAYYVAKNIVKRTKSKKISIKLRTLLRYAYVSYVRNTFDISTIRGLVPRIRPPSRFTSQYVYRDIEDMLRRNFKVMVERRRQHTYVIFYKE
ncbi:MAG: hypothetical protein DRJ32_03030 [Thermoprotei archaeon]|nr:MAG: hypothetical protein B6U94_02870 [Thermofilum sp. ex4484_79]RLE60337.1 MAG: hypothetical protein DRJ32_03030 [Thermoprotei archaeon]HDD64327.1 hypothetical protein [Thermoprotei archaeon]